MKSNITLIASAHSENGKCNSDELYKIIESIGPDVIFDEIPDHLYDKYYSNSSGMKYALHFLLNRRPPEIPYEVKCIKEYKKNNNIEIILGDNYVSKELSVYEDEFLEFLVKKEVFEKNIIESQIRKDWFFYIYNLSQTEVCDNRENVMLQNIYNLIVVCWGSYPFCFNFIIFVLVS